MHLDDIIYIGPGHCKKRMCHSCRRGPKIVDLNYCQGVEHPGFLVVMSSKAWNGPSPFTLEMLGYSSKQVNLDEVGNLSMVLLMAANHPMHLLI